MKKKLNIKKENLPDFRLISKTIFFPKQGILAIGDFHLGYDTMLKNQGITLNFDQLKETKKELENIIRNIRATQTLKKIILLGDIKHHFEFEKSELFNLRNFLNFLEKFVKKENIILIKGNHDTFTLKDYELKEEYLENNLLFIHGDKNKEKYFKSKKINTIILSHIHPAIILRDKQGIKREKYKCFLIGKFQRKNIIIIPSFFPIIEGSEINELESSSNKWNQIIPNEKLKSFETFIIGKNKIFNFGKYNNIK
jgi:putative SbcD/Mre11-related phosphoesterase